MLIPILLASLGTLNGSPVPLANSSIDADADNIWTRDIAAEGNGDNFRTTYGIVWSCVVTVFACVWSSAHPNIPGPRDAGWTCLKRRAATMLCALLAPEMMAMWAIRQYNAANRIARDYNEKIAKASPPRKSRWDDVKIWFTELPEAEAQRKSSQTWTKTHGFFVQMGGFILFENGCATRVLDYDDLKKSILEDQIDAPTLTVSEIKDRSKGDAISKGFVVLQTTWFMVQCLARLCKHLPLNELEVVTLGFALLNGIIYVLWWNKPQGVGVAVCVPLKPKKSRQLEVGSPGDQAKHDESADIEGTAVDSAGSETATPVIGHTECEKKSDVGDSEGNASADGATSVKMGWLRQHLVQDWSNYPSLVVIVFLVPFRCLAFPLHHLRKMFRESSVPHGALRVPMFYADERGFGPTSLYGTCVIGTVFGAVHLLAWSSDFRSRTELLLWRASTLIIILEPVLLVIIAILKDCKDRRLQEAIFYTITLPFTIALPFYMISRFALITLAFLSLDALPLLSFVAVPWTAFIPHF